MVEAILSEIFRKKFQKIGDKPTKERIISAIIKIRNKPEIGKPMRYARKNTRELYVSSFRISYEYNSTNKTITLLDFYHKDEQ